MIYCPNGGRGDGGGAGGKPGMGDGGGKRWNGEGKQGGRWGSAIMRQTIWFSEPPQGEDARASALT